MGWSALFGGVLLPAILVSKAILLFHLSFKTSLGSWACPRPALFQTAGAPLLLGFSYAAVGSFMVRAIRNFDMRFPPYSPFGRAVALASAI